MTRLLWLVDVLADAGVAVQAVDGWERRGREGVDPRVLVDHHTASSPLSGNVPSLNIVVNGRGDIPGPLCNLLLGRDNIVRVIASGVSNNAGKGGYAAYGATHNRHCIGHEVEHCGTAAEPVRPEMLATLARIDAAICHHLQWDSQRCIAHKEWAPRRKIDPYWSQDDHRARVAQILNPPPPITPGDMSMDFATAHTTVRTTFLDNRGSLPAPNDFKYWVERLMTDGYSGWAALISSPEFAPKG